MQPPDLSSDMNGRRPEQLQVQQGGGWGGGGAAGLDGMDGWRGHGGPQQHVQGWGGGAAVHAPPPGDWDVDRASDAVAGWAAEGAPPAREEVAAAWEANALAGVGRWYYVDPRGTLQGPFTLTLLHGWVSCGFLPADLLMYEGTEAGTVGRPLRDLILQYDVRPVQVQDVVGAGEQPGDQGAMREVGAGDDAGDDAQDDPYSGYKVPKLDSYLWPRGVEHDDGIGLELYDRDESLRAAPLLHDVDCMSEWFMSYTVHQSIMSKIDRVSIRGICSDVVKARFSKAGKK